MNKKSVCCRITSGVLLIAMWICLSAPVLAVPQSAQSVIDKTRADLQLILKQSPDDLRSTKFLKYLNDLQDNWETAIRVDPGSFDDPDIARYHETLQFYFVNRADFSKKNIDTLFHPPGPLRWYGIDELKQPSLASGNLKLHVAWFNLFAETWSADVLEKDRDLIVLGLYMEFMNDIRRDNEAMALMKTSDLDIIVKSLRNLPLLTDEGIAKLATLHQKYASPNDVVERHLKGNPNFNSRIQFYQAYLRPIKTGAVSPYRMLYQKCPAIFADRINALGKFVCLAEGALIAQAINGSTSTASQALERADRWHVEINQLQLPSGEAIETTLKGLQFTARDGRLLEEFRQFAPKLMSNLEFDIPNTDISLTDATAIKKIPRADDLDRMFRMVYDYYRTSGQVSVGVDLKCLQTLMARSEPILFKKANAK